MCLFAKHLDAKVAEEDITVFKVLTTCNHSPFQEMLYRPFERYFSPLEREDNTIRVFRGLHAFLDKKETLYWTHDRYLGKYGHANIHLVSTKAVEMKIPKGANYFLGKGNDIASNILIAGDLEPCCIAYTE